ncbi:MAG: hypothetical protein HZC28_10825 [Spirochaetes bacterium]|nr:hypothetical protein [Spirochaetota bacterium]
MKKTKIMTVKQLIALCQNGKSPKRVSLKDIARERFSIPVVRDAKKSEAPAIIAIDKIDYVKVDDAYELQKAKPTKREKKKSKK